MEFSPIKLSDGTELLAPMRVPADTSKGVGQVGYQVFLQDKTSGIKLHMEAVNRASKLFFTECYTVLHPFGGLGMAAQCMEKTLKRELTHEFWERDQECINALRTLYPHSEVLHTHDSFVRLKAAVPESLQGYDVLFLDPTAMTVKKDGLWPIWRKIAQADITYTWFVDSAISKWWLHTKTYSEFFGTPITDINTYFRAYDDLLRQQGLQILDLCREGTVVYGVVSAIQASPEPLEILDLRSAQ